MLIMNSIYPCLHFTLETQCEYGTGRLPNLDFEIWLDEHNIVRFSYYTKPTQCKNVVMKPRTMSENHKRAVPSTETTKRMRNMGERCPQSKRSKVLMNFTKKMLRSGYTRGDCKKYLRSRLIRYERMRETAAKEKRPLHRSAKSTVMSRFLKRVIGKNNMVYSRNQ